MLPTPCRWFVPVLVSLAAFAPVHADSPAAREVAKVGEEYLAYGLERHPALRQKLGQAALHLPDYSLEAERHDAELAAAWRARLEAVGETGLGNEDRLSRDVLLWQLADTERGAEHSLCFFLVTPYTWSFRGIEPVLADHRFVTTADLDGYLNLVREVPRVTGQLWTRLALQRERGILVPQPALPAVVARLTALGQPGDASPFAVSDERLSALPAAAVAEFRSRLRTILDTEAAPAFRALAAYLGPDYAAAAPAEIGLAFRPGCAAAYRWAVRSQTTLERTPEEIHQIGLEGVARLQARMAELRQTLGGPADAREFHAQLRRDPRFLAKTPEEVGERLMKPIRRLEPLVDRLFQRQPKAPYGVLRLELELEPVMTFGYYDAPKPGKPVGNYRFNGSKLEERSLVGAASLIYHELVPGHHFQIALQNENEALSPIRRELSYNAFAEGWAEYAAELPRELGLYDDPWDEYGRLTADIFLTTRLVVDTGMNALGWTRAQALEFMAANLLESEIQLQTETLRYATDLPAQALAYKMGAYEIRRLRDEAQKALGDRFDVRRFHDAVLGAGSVPLTVLGRHVARWVVAKKSAPQAGEK